MKKLLIALAAAPLLLSQAVLAQETTKPVLPKAITTEENLLRLPEAAAPAYDFSPRQVPQGMVVPAEWEESKAVLLAWPYPSSGTSNYSRLWAKLMNTIQQECAVWILVDQYSDTVQVHNYLGAQGVTLNSYQFMQKPTNAFWARDFGPWGFYHGTNDSLGFVDIRYYNSRPLDNAVPAWLANHLSIPNYQSLIKMEGGNFMVDGFGHGFYSSRLADNNANANIQSPTWTSAATMDTVQNIFNLSTVTQLQKLVCDGGTGHIDMYVKLLDEETLLVSEYPQVVTASDRQTIENNVALMQTLTTTYGRPFKVKRIEMPTRNDGSYSLTCTQINNDARGFVNGLFVNKTFIFPSYSSTTTGNIAGDSAAVAMYRKLLPGYKIVPIDARTLTTSGGAIHCITMQIPADNPIRFWHPSIEGAQSLGNSGYHILARITNKSGIAQAQCHWRKKGASAWSAVALSDSAGYHTGYIPNQAFASSDTIEYYLDALSNNGKEMSKPMVAPEGFYTFYFSPVNSTPGTIGAYPHNHLFAAYPNPAQASVTVGFYLKSPASVQVTLTDALGRVVHRSPLSDKQAGTSETQLNTAHLAPGIYFYSLYANGELVKTRKLIIE